MDIREDLHFLKLYFYWISYECNVKACILFKGWVNSTLDCYHAMSFNQHVILLLKSNFESILFYEPVEMQVKV